MRKEALSSWKNVQARAFLIERIGGEKEPPLIYLSRRALFFKKPFYIFKHRVSIIRKPAFLVHFNHFGLILKNFLAKVRQFVLSRALPLRLAKIAYQILSPPVNSHKSLKYKSI